RKIFGNRPLIDGNRAAQCHAAVQAYPEPLSQKSERHLLVYLKASGFELEARGRKIEWQGTAAGFSIHVDELIGNAALDGFRGGSGAAAVKRCRQRNPYGARKGAGLTQTILKTAGD